MSKKVTSFRADHDVRQLLDGLEYGDMGQAINDAIRQSLGTRGTKAGDGGTPKGDELGEGGTDLNKQVSPPGTEASTPSPKNDKLSAKTKDGDPINGDDPSAKTGNPDQDFPGKGAFRPPTQTWPAKPNVGTAAGRTASEDPATSASDTTSKSEPKPTTQKPWMKYLPSDDSEPSR